MINKKIVFLFEAVAAISAVIVILCNLDYFRYKNLEIRGYDLRSSQSYLEKYPSGRFSAIIQKAIEKKEDDFVSRYFFLDKSPDEISEQDKKSMLSYENKYKQLFPSGRYTDVVHSQVEICSEDAAYNSLLALKYPSSSDYYRFLKRFPQSSHFDEISQLHRKSLGEEATKRNTYENRRSSQRFSSIVDETKKTTDNAISIARTTTNSSERKSVDNSSASTDYNDSYLSNGSQPYSKYYGRNRVYSESDHRSAYQISASDISDVIAIIKKGDKNGPVVGHVYVRRGMTATVHVPPNSTYQVFFYSGQGWDSEKTHGPVKGGFSRNEAVQHAKPEFINDLEIIKYYLKETRSGNLKLSSNQNINDAF